MIESESPMRVVIDTNIWSSGLLWKGLPWHVLRLAEENKVEIVAMLPMLEELETVLYYSRLQPRRLELSLEIADLIAYATTLVSMVELERIEPVVIADPDDDVFVKCAVAAGAKYLIPGDKHLLALEQWQGIPVVTPPRVPRTRISPPSGQVNR